MTALWVALGAAVGAPARYLLDRYVQARHGGAFPRGILVVNVLGSFVLGVVAGAAAPPVVAALVGTGFCGAFTTWSTLAQDTVALARGGDRRAALLNALGTLSAGSVAAALGLVAGMAVGR
ncbi:camphor resistance protein CrcB [Pseudonocardia thermophila]|uniref:Fluoride-specific ion channel FluC n=1 Tax=Pseudonocardia thermophila TaxID=1848 RepID=A0A1M6YLJ8_PSETH|nr:fluoride efflux transporter CrcB [Pseudonocardia thermophila]SHL18952.1 camphor resistance protein CrcB [Pseudonocardia thermophila]